MPRGHRAGDRTGRSCAGLRAGTLTSSTACGSGRSRLLVVVAVLGGEEFVSVVSTSGTVTHPGYASLYEASKSAVNAFTVVAAKELGPWASASTRSCPAPRTSKAPRAPGPW